MIDFAAVWLKHQIAAGETCLALRAAGYRWQDIVNELHLADTRDAQRCAALFLSADLQSRQTAAEGAGDAQHPTAT